MARRSAHQRKDEYRDREYNRHERDTRNLDRHEGRAPGSRRANSASWPRTSGIEKLEENDAWKTKSGGGGPRDFEAYRSGARGQGAGARGEASWATSSSYLAVNGGLLYIVYYTVAAGHYNWPLHSGRRLGHRPRELLFRGCHQGRGEGQRSPRPCPSSRARRAWPPTRSSTGSEGLDGHRTRPRPSRSPVLLGIINLSYAGGSGFPLVPHPHGLYGPLLHLPPRELWGVPRAKLQREPPGIRLRECEGGWRNIFRVGRTRRKTMRLGDWGTTLSLYEEAERAKDRDPPARSRDGSPAYDADIQPLPGCLCFARCKPPCPVGQRDRADCRGYPHAATCPRTRPPWRPRPSSASSSLPRWPRNTRSSIEEIDKQETVLRGSPEPERADHTPPPLLFGQPAQADAPRRGAGSRPPGDGSMGGRRWSYPSSSAARMSCPPTSRTCARATRKARPIPLPNSRSSPGRPRQRRPCRMARIPELLHVIDKKPRFSRGFF